jgi:hypothetical protein
VLEILLTIGRSPSWAVVVEVARGPPVSVVPTYAAAANETLRWISRAAVDTSLNADESVGWGRRATTSPPHCATTAYDNSSPSPTPPTPASSSAPGRGATSGIRHELVILPLPDAEDLGTRAVSHEGTVHETGSITEAAANYGPGTGTGITPGSTAWTTATLAAGRYELLCNLPGHYAAGMYTELDVT